MVELNVLRAAARQRDTNGMRVDDFCVALQVLHLSVLCKLSGAAREAGDHGVLEVAKLCEVDRRLAELDTPGGRVARFAQDLRDVEQRFRRNAAAIHADAARIRFGVDDRNAESEISGEKSGRITAWAAADHNELSGDHVRRFSFMKARRSHEGHEKFVVTA